MADQTPDTSETVTLPFDNQSTVTVTSTATSAVVQPNPAARIKALVEKLEAEVEELGTIKSMFHVAEIKSKVKAIIAEAKTIL